MSSKHSLNFAGKSLNLKFRIWKCSCLGHHHGSRDRELRIKSGLGNMFWAVFQDFICVHVTTLCNYWPISFFTVFLFCSSLNKFFAEIIHQYLLRFFWEGFILTILCLEPYRNNLGKAETYLYSSSSFSTIFLQRQMYFGWFQLVVVFVVVLGER